VTDWLLIASIGGLVLSGTFALLWLADDIASFREGHWPADASDDEIARAGDSFLATFDDPSHFAPVIEGRQPDHDA
jgi:hypothetical protein